MDSDKEAGERALFDTEGSPHPHGVVVVASQVEHRRTRSHCSELAPGCRNPLKQRALGGSTFRLVDMRHLSENV